MATKTGIVKSAAWLTAGGLLGAGVALLFAPQSGRKARRDIAYLGKTARNKTEALRLELGHEIDNLVEGVSEKLLEGLGRGKEWTEKTRLEVVSALNSGKDYIQKEIERIKQKAA